MHLLQHAMSTCIVAATAVFAATAPALAQVPGDDSMGFDYPRAYDDDATGRFWDYAEEVLGSRIGYTAETNQNPESVTLQVGAVGMSERDRRLLHAAIPGPWVKLRLFETRYSIADLRAFGERAQKALRDAGLEGLWSWYSAAPLGEPNRVYIGITNEDFRARAVLRDALPDDAFVVDIGRAIVPLPGIDEPPPAWPRAAALLALVASVALVVALGPRPAQGSRHLDSTLPGAS